MGIGGIGKVLFKVLTPQEKVSFIYLSIMMVIGMILEMTTIFLLIPIFNYYGLAASHNPLISFLVSMARSVTHNPTQELTFYALLLLTFYFIKNAYSSFLVYVQYRFCYLLQGRLTNGLFASYLFSDYNFHVNNNSSSLIQNISGEILGFSTYVTIPFLTIITEMLVITGFFFVLLFQSPIGFGVTVIMMATFSYLFNRFYKARFASWGKQRYDFDQYRQKNLQESFSGIKEVKLFVREHFYYNRFTHNNNKSIELTQKQAVAAQYPRLWLEVIGLSSFPVFIIILYFQNQPFDFIITSLTLFAGASLRILPSLNRVLGSFGLFKYGTPVINLVENNLDRFAVEVEPTVEGKKELTHSIKFRNISFGYDPNELLFRDFNLEILKGQAIGIIGKSGSGKSTIADLLMGFFRPSNGDILIDGENLSGSMIEWRKNVGYVSQSIFLADDTIGNNVAFGLNREDIDMKKIQTAIKLACLTDFIATLPEGLNTIVGERGVKLSGGQRQRIGLARALYANPAVLILDEATSALDNTTEMAIMNDINQMHHSKTIIIIAHRLSTLKNCDIIYEIEKGHILKKGPPSIFNI